VSDEFVARVPSYHHEPRDPPKANDWGESLGFPTRRRTPSEADAAVMKKVLLISLAVVALLVLALGGWAVKSVRRAPAYA
jgi:hypothetical protein